MIICGIGMTFDFHTGTIRNWFMGPDLIKRWADNGEPCDKKAKPGQVIPESTKTAPIPDDISP